MLKDLKERVSKEMEIFNRQRVKFTNLVNQHQKFVQEFRKQQIAKNQNLRGDQMKLGDPSSARQNQKMADQI